MQIIAPDNDPILGTGSLDSAHLTRTISDTSGDAESDDDEPTEEEMIELAAQIKREEEEDMKKQTLVEVQETAGFEEP